MAKRKKPKPNVRQQRGQHRRAYLRKIVAMAEQMGVEDFRLLMTPEMYESLYSMRIKVVMEGDDDVPESVLRKARKHQDKTFGNYEITLTQDGASVSVRDFLTYGQTIFFFITSDKDIDLRKGMLIDGCRPAVLKERLAPFVDWIENGQEPYRRLQDIMWFVALPYSDLTQQLYWLTYRFGASEDARLVQTFELHTVRPEHRKIRVDGIARTVFRVGWALPEHGPTWSSVDGALFGQEGELPVFVQAHALHRMDERLDCTDRPLQQFHLFAALQNPEVVRNHQEHWLVTYYFKGYKVGYLVVEPVDNILLVRTFLFVTMDSTPEGSRLRESIGLEAVDKKYLAMDRLSTFLVSDIANHPDIKAHFVNAGCTDLFAFDSDAVGRWEIVRYIRSYLDVPQDEELTEVPDPVESEA